MDLTAPVSPGLLLVADVLAKGTALLLLAGAATALLRRAPASLRHLLWLCALTALPLLPVVSAVVRTRPAAVPSALTIPLPVPAPRTPPRLAPTAATPPPPSAAVRPGAPANGSSWLPATVVAVYAVGVAVVGAQVAAGMLCVRRFAVRGSTLPVPSETGVALDAALAALRLRRPVRLVLSPDAPVPMTWGWRRPTVLLPADAPDWAGERVRVALLHEAAHIARGDWAAQMLAHAVCALFWFHPLVWWAAARLRAEAEQAADDRVLLTGVPAKEYARHLLEIAARVRRSSAAPPAVSTAMAAGPRIEKRLRHVLSGGAPGTAAHPAFIPLLVLVSLPVALLRPEAARSAGSPPTEPQRTTFIAAVRRHNAIRQRLFRKLSGAPPEFLRRAYQGGPTAVRARLSPHFRYTPVAGRPLGRAEYLRRPGDAGELREMSIDAMSMAGSAVLHGRTFRNAVVTTVSVARKSGQRWQDTWVEAEGVPLQLLRRTEIIRTRSAR